MSKITREQLQTEFEKFKEICELPELYLENYFIELRNNVDKCMVLNEMNLETDELNENWKEVISKIDTFENDRIKNRELMVEEEIQKEIQLIEAILNDPSETNDLNKIKEKIQTEEDNFLKNLFQNKTLIFLNVNSFLKASVKKRTSNKLILISDEFVNLFRKRFNF